MTTPAPPQGSPCEPWEFDPACCTVTGATAPQILRAREIATEILWSLSGRRIGPSCPLTVRPCRLNCNEGGGIFLGSYGGLSPYIDNGVWRNASPCGTCKSECSCTVLSEVLLEGPVFDVVSVMEGADVLPADAYRVDYYKGWRLVRQDGGTWPACQDMAADVGEPGTLAVTYRTGLRLGFAGQAAFDALVCRLLTECGGTCRCSTPRNTTRVSRQGVEIEMHDILEMQVAGLTGVPETDRWLMSVNPNRLASPSRVTSPDAPRSRHRFTPIP